jgi:hypothetical protein
MYDNDNDTEFIMPGEGQDAFVGNYRFKLRLPFYPLYDESIPDEQILKELEEDDIARRLIQSAATDPRRHTQENRRLGT